MISSMNVSVLGVADLSRSREFYVDHLSLTELTMAEPMPGRHWLELGFATGQTKLALVNADGWQVPPRPGPAMTVTCEDIVGTVTALRTHGITVSDPVETPWGFSADLEDPDGHVIILGQQGAASP